MSYRLPARYRRRYRSSSTKRAIGLALGAVLVIAAGTAGPAAARHHGVSRHRQPAAAGTIRGPEARAVAFARAQVGVVPYVWGGTTRAGMDCSGLTQAAYASAGIRVERTSEQQWASERHVTTPRAGDSVFFAGADGTPASPGHVGIVVSPARHLAIDAYGAGTYVRYDTYGLASSAPGLRHPVGFTSPEG